MIDLIINKLSHMGRECEYEVRGLLWSLGGIDLASDVAYSGDDHNPPYRPPVFIFASARCESNLFDCVNCIESSETPTVHSHLLISKAWTSVSIATYLMFRPPLKISSLSSPYLSFTDVQLGSHAAFYVPVNPFFRPRTCLRVTRPTGVNSLMAMESHMRLTIVQ